MSNKSGYTNFAKKGRKYEIWDFRSKMGVSGEKVPLVGQFEIMAQDNFFSSKVRLVGQFFGNPVLLDGLKLSKFNRN